MSAGEVNLFDLPSRLAEMLNIPLFAGQILATGIVMLVFLLPVLYLTRGKSVVATLFSGFIALCLCIAIGWLPVWILLVLVLLIAAMWSGKIKEWVT